MAIAMNIISPKNNVNTVSLKELIPQHDTLKLLILHTPFPLDIATLPQCLSLVKIDLSRNKIKSFPYLGHLRFLRIAFLHENQLSITQFVKIFEKNGERSTLSDNIVWITYWGNKNVFLARHYVINNTNALAFDKNIIVEQERMPNLLANRKAFCRQSDISQILSRRNVSNYSTEEEYMQDFWLTLKMLRQKNERLNPIIKVQKVYRGWIFREKLKREYARERENYLLLYRCFREWKNSRKKQKKLYSILKEKRKTYLLYPSSKINRHYILARMKQLAQAAKEAVLKRRLRLDNEIKFYSVLRGNYLMLHDLYEWLQLKESPAIYLYRDNIQQFKEHVLPFVRLFTAEAVQCSPNDQYLLHYLYQPISKSHWEFVKMVKTNRLSIASFEKPLEKMLRLIKFKKLAPIEAKMKSIFGKFHMSSEKKTKMEEYDRRLQQTKKQEMSQLVRIEGSYQLLQTIVRGIFFFNSKRLTLPSSYKLKRINLLSQRALKRVSSAVSIQRAWKGYIFRKKHQSQLKLILKFQKAATIIQRWFKKLPTLRKKYFIFDLEQRLNQCTESSFVLDFDQYYQLFKPEPHKKDYFILLEQHSCVYKHKATGKLVVTWDDQSSRKQIATMIVIHKSLLPHQFYRKKIGLTQQQIGNRTVYQQGKVERCDVAHLVHYQTTTSIIKRFGKTFLHVECHHKSQARFRMLGLSLLSYNFKQRRPMCFYSRQAFSGIQYNGRQQLCKRQLSIVCNENSSFIKTIEENCIDIDSLSINIISNKIFLQFDINRQPFKVEERFFVYLINHPATSVLSYPQLPLASQIKRSNTFIDPQIDRSSVGNSDSTEVARWQFDRRILVKKKSIRQFKAKLKKKRENPPSFIIDNKSTDRFTQHQSEPNQRSIRQLGVANQPQTPINSNQKNLIRALVLQQRSRRNLELKREQESFTKKFVNMGNFMQNQFVNDHRRRMKTEIEQIAHASAEQIRLSANRSASYKEDKTNRRYAKARELEEAHRSLLRQSLAEGEERSILLKKNVQSYQKKIKDEGRKPRVSFVEENFPLISSKGRNLSVG